MVLSLVSDMLLSFVLRCNMSQGLHKFSVQLFLDPHLLHRSLLPLQIVPRRRSALFTDCLCSRSDDSWPKDSSAYIAVRYTSVLAAPSFFRHVHMCPERFSYYCVRGIYVNLAFSSIWFRCCLKLSNIPNISLAFYLL